MNWDVGAGPAPATIYATVNLAYPRDVCRGVGRISYDSMVDLDVSPGEIMEVSGKRQTLARCMPLDITEMTDGTTIRMDKPGRRNAGVDVMDKVLIRKVRAARAERVVVMSAEPRTVPIEMLKYMARDLEDVPVTLNDVCMVPWYGTRRSIRIVDTVPKPPAVIADDTKFSLLGPQMADMTPPGPPPP